MEDGADGIQAQIGMYPVKLELQSILVVCESSVWGQEVLESGHENNEWKMFRLRDVGKLRERVREAELGRRVSHN